MVKQVIVTIFNVLFANLLVLVFFNNHDMILNFVSCFIASAATIIGSIYIVSNIGSKYSFWGNFFVSLRAIIAVVIISTCLIILSLSIYKGTFLIKDLYGSVFFGLFSAVVLIVPEVIIALLNATVLNAD